MICTALILPTGELSFEPVVFNRRQHQLQDLMGGLEPLSALSAYRDPHILHVFLENLGKSFRLVLFRGLQVCFLFPRNCNNSNHCYLLLLLWSGFV